MAESNPWEDAKESIKNQRKNIFDDDVTYDMAKQIILSDTIEESKFQVEDEMVDWNSDILTTLQAKPDLDNLGTPSSASPGITTALPKDQSKNLQGHNRTPSSSSGIMFTSSSDYFIPGKDFDQSIDDVLAISKKKQPTPELFDKLNAELISLKRINLISKHDRWSKLPAKDTIRRMVKGENYTFELYRSLEDKLSLVDEAISMHDGDCIIAAILFLKRTVKPSIFQSELSVRPEGLNHYLSYLRCNSDFRELSNILEMIGRSEEAAMLQYKIATGAALDKSKPAALRNVHRTHFQMDPLLSSEAGLVLEHIDLLERQLPIEDSDAKEEATGRNQLLRQFPRKKSLYGMPLVTTLYYCCLYHFHLSENSLASPIGIKKRHQLSDKQFLYSAIGAQAKLKNWLTIEELLTTKSWFGGVKMKSVIGFDKVVEILEKNNAPLDVLHKYIQFIDDLEFQLDVAKRVKCHKAVVDVLVKMRERDQLEAYATKLDTRSDEFRYAKDALISSSTKWK